MNPIWLINFFKVILRSVIPELLVGNCFLFTFFTFIWAVASESLLERCH